VPSANEWSVPRLSAPDACASSSGSPCRSSMSTGDEPPYSNLCPARGRQRNEVPVLSHEACLQEERSPLARAIAALTADRTARDRYVSNARAARPTARRRTRRASIASSRDDTRLSLASSSARLVAPACPASSRAGPGTVGSRDLMDQCLAGDSGRPVAAVTWPGCCSRAGCLASYMPWTSQSPSPSSLPARPATSA
jgi:hypothetical protein